MNRLTSYVVFTFAPLTTTSFTPDKSLFLTYSSRLLSYWKNNVSQFHKPLHFKITNFITKLFFYDILQHKICTKHRAVHLIIQ